MATTPSYNPSHFTTFDIKVPSAQLSNPITIHGVKSIISKGKPPLLCLHGFPQTHHIYSKVAPFLIEHFDLVITDLRGYGKSSKPEGDEKHEMYSKREMARDQVEVMCVAYFPPSSHRQILLKLQEKLWFRNLLYLKPRSWRC